MLEIEKKIKRETRQGALSVWPLSDFSRSSCGYWKAVQAFKENEITPILD
jgi:hypothetical protein